jgi:DNA-binding CsgD family transcriptional regulator
MVEEMKRLEAEGLTRAEIAEKLDVDRATVTRYLGAVRQYRGARLQSA